MYCSSYCVYIRGIFIQSHISHLLFNNMFAQITHKPQTHSHTHTHKNLINKRADVLNASHLMFAFPRNPAHIQTHTHAHTHIQTHMHTHTHTHTHTHMHIHNHRHTHTHTQTPQSVSQ